MNSLEKLRQDINELDRQLLHLLSERVHVALQMFELKKRSNLPLYDPVREKEILEDCSRRVKEPLDVKDLQAFVSLLIRIGKNVQCRKENKPMIPYSDLQTHLKELDQDTTK